MLRKDIGLKISYPGAITIGRENGERINLDLGSAY